jgi:predicted ATPase/class 3 adenylate cyclase
VLVPTVTFLFTDIEGSTALLQRVGESVYAEVLAEHHQLIRSALAAHTGREVDTQGDAFFAVFSSPRDCAGAVLQMQKAVQGHSWPAGASIRVRMGVHTGDATRTSAGLVGLDVHRAARIAAVAHGGQVVVSQAAATLLRDALPPGAALTDLGEHRLKDLGRAERIFQLHAAGLPAQFPPLRSLGNPALLNNLPSQPTRFIGRAAELAEIRTLLDSSRLVTLAGAGGCGKTRLGLQIAAELLDGSGDGVWLVELAPVSDGDAVAGSIAAALRIPVQPDRSALDVLVDALAFQHILIVLDNCEHLLGACAKTVDALLRRCPRVHVIATSREPLTIAGETVYRVPSLSLPDHPVDNADSDLAAAAGSDAVALLVDRAAAQGVSLTLDGRDRPLEASVCRRLDGLPLAIELAASRLRSMSLQDLDDRLHDRFRLLTGGSRAGPARHQTLRATVDWSYSLLTPAEQAVLRRLPAFAGGFDLDAAEAVCGFGDIEASEVAQILGSLADKSLVVTEHHEMRARYRLLETIRDYAAEQVSSSEGEAAATAAAHCSHFLSLAEMAMSHRFGHERESWLARLDANEANLAIAVRYAAGNAGSTEVALRFAVALRHYWWSRSRLQDAAAEFLMPVLARPDARADLGLFTAALITGSAIANDATEARRLAQQAVQVARSLGDDRLLCTCLGRLASAYTDAGDADAGRPCGLEAVERARQLGDNAVLAFSLSSYLYTADLPWTDAEPLHDEAIACTETSGDLINMVNVHQTAARAALLAGSTLAARAHVDQAARWMKQVGADFTSVHNDRAWVMREQRDPDALAAFEAALRMAHGQGARQEMATAILGLACHATDAGSWQRAAELHGAAEAIRKRSGWPWAPIAAAKHGDCLAKARSGLENGQFDQLYRQGLSLSMEKAVEFALAQR